MPKIGDIKVGKGKGHRLHVWTGAKWKSVALQNRHTKNSKEDIEPRKLNVKRRLNNLIGTTNASIIEIEVKAAPLVDRKTLRKSALIHTVRTSTDNNYLFLPPPSECTSGQLKFIVFKRKTGVLSGDLSLNIQSGQYLSGTVYRSNVVGDTILFFTDGVNWFPLNEKDWHHA